MPKEIKEAVNYAVLNGAKENYEIVDMVRDYFNENNIEYSTFSYDDLLPYL